MSFSKLKPYFQERLQAVDSGLKEWKDAFNINNIPATIADKAWHIDLGPFNYLPGSAQTSLPFNCQVELSVIVKGYREPQLGVDKATALAESIVKEVCDPLNRLTQAKTRNIKNVLPNLVNIRRYSESNDNLVVIEIRFDCEIYL